MGFSHSRNLKNAAFVIFNKGGQSTKNITNFFWNGRLHPDLAQVRVMRAKKGERIVKKMKKIGTIKNHPQL